AIGVNLELKGAPGCPERLAEIALTRACAVWSAVAPPPLISSFEPTCLTVAARVVPEWPRGMLMDDIDDDWRERAAWVGAAAIIVNHLAIDGSETVASLGSGGRAVLAYTVNQPERACELRGWGVAAVIADRPENNCPILK
ncbi:MAG: glycerophosphodiester phosphodiesterase family protein, partial [Rhodospirillaceae bacterium]